MITQMLIQCRKFAAALCPLLPALRADQLPVHRGAGGAGLHRGHRALRHQRLLRVPAELGGAAPPVPR